MKYVLVTGSSGLIGSEAVRFFAQKGFSVLGIDNDMRRYFFGAAASTRPVEHTLSNDIPAFRPYDCDIRDGAALERVFSDYTSDIVLIIHAAAQPSHDWAAREPLMDFSINATATVSLLEMARRYCPQAVFIFTSTNKVYGDMPNRLPVMETATRWELPATHPFFDGIDESMSIDQSTHSLFGASKAAADLFVQEYGRYFGMKTVVFRGGCLTGPQHAGVELHGFLSYLMKCCVVGKPYTVFGYKGKQVRDTIHSADVVSAFYEFYQAPRCGEVYNIGGGRENSCSMHEAITLCEEISGKKLQWNYADENRVGDHIWYISNMKKFMSHYSTWKQAYTVRSTLEDIYQACVN